MAFLSYSSPHFLRLRQFFPSCISESDLLEALGRPGETFFPCLKSAARGARINFFPFILTEISPSPIQEYVPSYGHNTKFMQQSNSLSIVWLICLEWHHLCDRNCAAMSIFIIRELGYISVVVRILVFVTQSLHMQDNNNSAESEVLRPSGHWGPVWDSCIIVFTHSMTDSLSKHLFQCLSVMVVTRSCHKNQASPCLHMSHCRESKIYK